MKCTLCNKEFSDDVSDYELVQHFINEHNKEVKSLGKDILKAEKAKKGKINKSVHNNGIPDNLKG